jgi:predicted phage tail protein
MRTSSPTRRPSSLSRGHHYRFRVRAVDGVGNSSVFAYTDDSA